jgi:hypothetical protein
VLFLRGKVFSRIRFSDRLLVPLGSSLSVQYSRLGLGEIVLFFLLINDSNCDKKKNENLSEEIQLTFITICLP